MKKILNILCSGVGIIIAIPILLIVCIGYLVFVPFDILRYHRMPYYKDLGIKYQFFITSRDIVKTYNYLTGQNLPIEYVGNGEYEYFVNEGQVLLCGWSYEDFRQVEGEWYFVLNDECDAQMTMKEIIENEIELLKTEHKSLPVKFLILINDATDVVKLEKAKECPYFYCIGLID